MNCKKCNALFTLGPGPKCQTPGCRKILSQKALPTKKQRKEMIKRATST